MYNIRKCFRARIYTSIEGCVQVATAVNTSIEECTRDGFSKHIDRGVSAINRLDTGHLNRYIGWYE